MSSKFTAKLFSHIRNGTFLKVLKNYFCKPVNYFKRKYPGLVERDLYNKIRYGLSAPLNHERIWINPKDVKHVLVPSEVKRITGKTRNYTSGLVIDWDEVENIRPLFEEHKIQYCIKHWQDGESWEDLDVINFLRKNSKKHRKKEIDELIERFEMLDKAFEEVKNEGRLKTRIEIDPSNYREKDGILIHIGKNGEPIFGSCGNHRLAMALILGFEKIPAWIGLVDKDSIKYLDQYRKPPRIES